MIIIICYHQMLYHKLQSAFEISEILIMCVHTNGTLTVHHDTYTCETYDLDHVDEELKHNLLNFSFRPIDVYESTGL